MSLAPPTHFLWNDMAIPGGGDPQELHLPAGLCPVAGLVVRSSVLAACVCSLPLSLSSPTIKWTRVLGSGFVVKACLPLPLAWVRVLPRSECWAKQDPKAEAMASAIKCSEQIRKRKAACDLPGLGALALLEPHCRDSPGGLQEANGARGSLAHPLSLCELF